MSERKRPRKGLRVLAFAFVAAGLVAGAVALRSVWRARSAPAFGAPAEALHFERAPRSVVLITLDTTRADQLEPYGATGIETPTLQRLADEGLVLEHAYSVAPITLVAHTSILSGLWPPQHGVRNNGIHYVAGEIETLAERLAQRDFRTAAFVSAAVLERRYGLDQGFEVYDDDLSSGRERHPRMVPDRPAEATVDAATAWLDRLGDGERFFLWVHLYDPHASYSPPPPFREQYRDNLYRGEIAYMDSQLARLLDHRRLRRDEVVTMVIGDHGESLGEHGEQTHALLAYDSTLHIPWIVRSPGGPAGVRVGAPVSQVDVTPTVLDLLGLGVPAELPGRSLAQLLEAPGRWPARGLYAETYLPFYTYGWAKLKAWIRGSAKLIAGPTVELFDLRRDPRELSDRSSQQPGTTADLETELTEFLAAHGDAEREAVLALDSESAEELRALGYLAVGSGPAEAAGPRPHPKDVIHLHTGLERARQFQRDGFYERAIAAIERVLEEDPNNIAALMDLARNRTLAGDPDGAAAVLERAIALDPNYAPLQLLLASVEAQRGHLERALAVIEVARGIDPRLPDGIVQHARLLSRLDRADEAQRVLSAALAEQPQNALLGAVYAQLVELRGGDLQAARERLLGVLERDPFLVLAWRLLGQVEERLGDVDAALASYREGLRRQPDNAELHGRLGILLAQRGAGAETEAHLREALRLFDGLGEEWRVALGAWLAEHGRFQEALREYDTVLAVLPEHPGALNNRAVALFQSGQLEEARQALLELVTKDPSLGDPYNNLAAIAVLQEDWDAAARYARSAVARQPDLVPAWNNLGVGLDEQGKLDGAERAYRRALELDPAYWQARLNLGIVLRKQERFEEALGELQRVLEQEPSLLDCHLELAALYAGPLAEPEKARAHYNAFLRLAPGHPAAAEVRRRIAELEPAGASR